MRFQPSTMIRYADLGDVLVVLDLATESYHVIDPVGRSMWNHLVRLPHRTDVVQALREEYAVDPARLEADLDAFIARTLKQGFLEEHTLAPAVTESPRAVGTRRGFLALRAWGCLALTARGLSARGFATTYLRYARLPSPTALADGAVAQDLLRGGVAAFRRAEGYFYLRRAPLDCLPRSLALFRFLRAIGLRVEHHIGVKRFPFTAHAWVEYEETVVHESSTLCRSFTTIATLA